MDRWAHRRGEPRLFAFFWALYLFLGTIVCLGALGARGIISPETYRPAVRLLLLLAAVGIALLWPMVRLSQQRPKGSVSIALLKDLIVILAPVQAVVWPQWWWARWPLEVVAALAAYTAAWAILAGGCLVAALGGEADGAPRGRAAAMAVLVAAALAGPAIGLAVSPPVQSAWAASLGTVSPLTGVHELTRDRFWTGRSATLTPAHWWSMAGVAGVGLLVWLAGSIAGRRGPREAGGINSP